MGELTVSAGYTKSLVDVAVARGVGQAALLAEAQLKAADLKDADARIPFARFKALMRAAKTLSGDPAFALHFGATSDFAELSVVGLISHSAATMGEAFEQMNRYARLVVDFDATNAGGRFAIARRRDGVWIEDRRANPDDFPELTESTWARFVWDFARAFPKRPNYVKAVHVTHPRPAHAAAYREILKAPVTFGSDRNALLIDESWLDIRLGKTNRYAFGVFNERAAALLRRLEQSATARGQVELHLIPILHTGDTGMDRIAKLMGVSRPTLYRRLKAEGVTYEAVLDGLRRRMAEDYLKGRKLTANQAAYLVGFSDPSAFSRAFKRWTGRAPGGRKSGGSR